MENEVMVATELQLVAGQPPNGATMSVIRVSAALLPPVESVLVVALMSAIVPASQMLTYT